MTDGRIERVEIYSGGDRKKWHRVVHHNTILENCRHDETKQACIDVGTIGSKTPQPTNLSSKIVEMPRRVLSSDLEVGIHLANSKTPTNYGFDEQTRTDCTPLNRISSQLSSTVEGRGGNITSSQLMADSMSSAKMSAKQQVPSALSPQSFLSKRPIHIGPIHRTRMKTDANGRHLMVLPHQSTGCHPARRFSQERSNDTLSITSLNVKNLKTNMNFLKHLSRIFPIVYLQEHGSIDIKLISSQRFIILRNLSGYVDDNEPVPLSLHMRGYCGTSILWHSALNSVLRKLPETSTRINVVELKWSVTPFCLANVYLPARCVAENEIGFEECLDVLHEHFIKYGPTHIIICSGDFKRQVDYVEMSCSKTS